MTLRERDTFDSERPDDRMDIERWEDDGGHVMPTANSDAELTRMLKTQAAEIEDRDIGDWGDPFTF